MGGGGFFSLLCLEFSFSFSFLFFFRLCPVCFSTVWPCAGIGIELQSLDSNSQ